MLIGLDLNIFNKKKREPFRDKTINNSDFCDVHYERRLPALLRSIRRSTSVNQEARHRRR